MGVIVVDTEHSSGIYNYYEDGFYLTLVGIYYEDGSDDLIWFDHCDRSRTENGLGKIQEAIDNASEVVFHNAKHDIQVLTAFGIDLSDAKIHCTMLTEYLLRGQDKTKEWNLNAVAANYGLDQKHDEIKDMWDSGIQTYDIPDYKLGPYCIQDCLLTYQIYLLQRQQMEGEKISKVIDLQNEYTHVLSEMEMNGFRMDIGKAEAIIKEYGDIAEGYRLEMAEIVGDNRINLSSSQQLSAMLYGGKLKLKHKEWVVVEYKTKPYSDYREREFEEVIDYVGLGFKPDKKKQRKDGYFKTDKKTIEALPAGNQRKRRVKWLLVHYSRAAQVVKTLRSKTGAGLLSKIQPDGLVHPNLNQVVAATGRLTSSDPNGQNLPRGNTSPIKKCIVPSLDGIMQVDLSQIEWRTAAWLSQDPVMIHEINNGIDQHAATVVDLMELTFKNKKDPESKKNRDHAKTFNFRMIYGGTEWGFYLDIDMPAFAIGKWKQIIVDFFKKYAGLDRWQQDSIKFVLEHGFLQLPTGRWFKFHKVGFEDGMPVYKYNQIKNYPVQGMSGGDFLPLMAVVIRRGMRKLGLKSKMFLTVHDSIVFDYLESEKKRLAKLCYEVGNNLDKYIRSYFGLNWNVDLECEVEAGPTYGDLNFIPYEEVGL
jgi:DNA polymerase-1